MTEPKLAKGLMVDLLFSGGVLNESESPRATNQDGYLGFYYGRLNKAGKGNLCKQLCDLILDRSFKFNEMDDILDEMTDDRKKCRVNPDCHADGYHTGTDDSMAYFTENDLAQAIAWFCADSEIYWDDVFTTRSTYELEAYKKSTLGKALYDAKCFLSEQQEDGSAAAPKAKTATAAGTKAPKSDYKSRGPLSKLLRSLIGKPNDKVFADTKDMFKIKDVSISGKEVRAFLKPLTTNKQGDAGGTNKVFIGTSTGYDDCTCWFDNTKDADAFLIECRKHYANPANLKVVRSHSDPNGYFLVNTEYGKIVAISAIKVNEDLEGQVDEPEEKDPDEVLKEQVLAKEAEDAKKERTFGIGNIEVFEDAFYKYD